MHNPTVGSQGGAVSYERGTPVQLNLYSLTLTFASSLTSASALTFGSTPTFAPGRQMTGAARAKATRQVTTLRAHTDRRVVLNPKLNPYGSTLTFA